MLFALIFSGLVAAEVILYGSPISFGTDEQRDYGIGQFRQVDITTAVATEISVDIGLLSIEFCPPDSTEPDYHFGEWNRQIGFSAIAGDLICYLPGG